MLNFENFGYLAEYFYENSFEMRPIIISSIIGSLHMKQRISKISAF